PNGLGEDATVEGGHDVLHKARVGGGPQHGWRADNFEARVEDSWERNADAVAASVEKLLRERSVDMVMLSGDVRAVGLLRDALSRETRDRLIEVQGGSRGVALDRGPFREELDAATTSFIAARQRELAERFRERQARDGASVGGAAEVGQALERGQGEELVFVSGHEPAGIEELLRSALATDAAGSALEAATVGVAEGVGARLGWRGGSPPAISVGSMSGAPRRECARRARPPTAPTGRHRSRCRPVDRSVGGLAPGAGADEDEGACPTALRSRRDQEDPMPEEWSRKRERQYQHIKDGQLDKGASEDEAEEIAARTVNKTRAQKGESEEASRTSVEDK